MPQAPLKVSITDLLSIQTVCRCTPSRSIFSAKCLDAHCRSSKVPVEASSAHCWTSFMRPAAET